jgi:hypothetical protein
MSDAAAEVPLDDPFSNGAQRQDDIAPEIFKVASKIDQDLRASGQYHVNIFENATKQIEQFGKMNGSVQAAHMSATKRTAAEDAVAKQFQALHTHLREHLQYKVLEGDDRRRACTQSQKLGMEGGPLPLAPLRGPSGTANKLNIALDSAAPVEQPLVAAHSWLGGPSPSLQVSTHEKTGLPRRLSDQTASTDIGTITAATVPQNNPSVDEPPNPHSQQDRPGVQRLGVQSSVRDRKPTGQEHFLQTSKDLGLVRSATSANPLPVSVPSHPPLEGLDSTSIPTSQLARGRENTTTRRLNASSQPSGEVLGDFSNASSSWLTEGTGGHRLNPTPAYTDPNHASVNGQNPSLNDSPETPWGRFARWRLPVEAMNKHNLDEAQHNAISTQRLSMGISGYRGGSQEKNVRGSADLSKTNQLLQQLVDEARRTNRSALPLAGRYVDSDR